MTCILRDQVWRPFNHVASLPSSKLIHPHCYNNSESPRSSLHQTLASSLSAKRVANPLTTQMKTSWAMRPQIWWLLESFQSFCNNDAATGNRRRLLLRPNLLPIFQQKYNALHLQFAKFIGFSDSFSIYWATFYSGVRAKPRPRPSSSANSVVISTVPVVSPWYTRHVAR